MTATDATTALRELWNAKGVPEARQNEMLAEIEAKAQPGAQVGPFIISSGPRHSHRWPECRHTAYCYRSDCALPQRVTGRCWTCA